MGRAAAPFFERQSMSELEDIGRYHQLADAVRRKINARDDLLNRAARVLDAAIQEPRTAGAVGRKCNFEAIERMTVEAKALHEEALGMIDEMNALAPVANKSTVKLD